MTLGANERRRYARHVSLAEVGAEGQARLLAAHVREPASATTRDYLRRAGVSFAPDGLVPRAVCVRPDGLTRDPALRDAATAVLDAFAAVETFKAIVGAGVPATWPEGLVLDEDLP